MEQESNGAKVPLRAITRHEEIGQLVLFVMGPFKLHAPILEVGEVVGGIVNSWACGRREDLVVCDTPFRMVCVYC